MQELSKVLAGKYEEVIEKITSFSNEYLNDEYKNICIEATKMLFLNNEDEVKKGKSFSWAAGIVHAIGSVNNLFDSKEEPYIKALDLYKSFGVSSSTGSSKSKEVKRLLDISEENKKFIVANGANKDVKKEAALTMDKKENDDDVFRFAVSKKYVIAERMANRAWKEKNYHSKAKIAKAAIEFYEDCPDAYLILANNSKLNDEEKKELLEKAVKASENVLKIEDLKKTDYRLFKLSIAEPFFGAKYTLAMHLWKMGQKDGAIKELSEIIECNSDDRLLARGVLSSWLLISEKYDEAEALINKYENDNLAVINYNRAALNYKLGKLKEAESALRRAYKRNPFVVDYLLKKKTVKNSNNHGARLGSREEAEIYAQLGIKVWNDSNMISWLKEMKKDFEILNF